VGTERSLGAGTGARGLSTAAEVVAVDGERPDPAVVSRAAELLARGLLVIFPTDTLYAIGGRALDAAAARRVREAKGRPGGQPLPLVAADRDQVRLLCAAWPKEAERLAAAFWPGPLTLLLPAAEAVPVELTSGTGTVAVRIPALPLATALCAAAGPLISTSANRTGERAPVTCAEAVTGVGDGAALALDGGPGRPVASTIVDLASARPALVRAGAVAWDDVEAVLRGGS
jgi:L-threonylcarbamoyladenylate synthase